MYTSICMHTHILSHRMSPAVKSRGLVSGWGPRFRDPFVQLVITLIIHSYVFLIISYIIIIIMSINCFWLNT